MSAMTIHRNAPVNVAMYMLDNNGDPVAIDGGTYKCDVKNNKEDTLPVISFVSGGGVGVGSITIITEVDQDNVLRDWFVFETPDDTLPTALKEGSYVADLLRTDDPYWVCGFGVTVDEGVTS